MIIGSILIVGTIVLYFQFVQPAYENAQGVKAKFKSEEKFLSDESGLITQVKNLISSYQEQEQIRQAVSIALPMKEDIAGAIAQISGIAAQSALSITSISVTTVAPQTKKNAAGGATGVSPAQGSFQTTLQKPLGTTSFKISLTGGYENLKSFIAFLEKNLLVFDVKSISLKPVANAPNLKIIVQDAFDYEVAVTTYYQGQ
jgi:Tfp pilus assembly protein PilO